MTAELTYRWLVHTPGYRPAHAFVGDSAASLCTAAVRHPAVMANWQGDHNRQARSVCILGLRRDPAGLAWTTQRALKRLRCWLCKQAIARDDLSEVVV